MAQMLQMLQQMQERQAQMRAEARAEMQVVRTELKKVQESQTALNKMFAVKKY